ncbi:Cys-tRNA(Pro) deacylase [Terriglobus aquaticus]|uniref:Cys-tRNA(Pro)/Cys-tRNA(Cys) deacylase n=1 Tax=Terriglobus aquaticus TaxID=940139 RepID=A0ABW9KIU4_9BACT|nr:Cys-tRNA(Pro) deacylase [Terriglobus aquaticus]
MKTNACRVLDQLGIAYRTQEYAVDPNDLAATTVAAKIGMPVEQVYKTLLCHMASGEYVFAVIAGDAELDLKKLAAAAGEKKAELAPLKQLEPLTGYIRGGCTALAAKREFPVYADELMELHEVISVSAGVRGMQMLLAPADYLRATHATVADLTKATLGSAAA